MNEWTVACDNEEDICSFEQIQWQFQWHLNEQMNIWLIHRTISNKRTNVRNLYIEKFLWTNEHCSYPSSGVRFLFSMMNAILLLVDSTSCASPIWIRNKIEKKTVLRLKAILFVWLFFTKFDQSFDLMNEWMICDHTYKAQAHTNQTKDDFDVSLFLCEINSFCIAVVFNRIINWFSSIFWIIWIFDICILVQAQNHLLFILISGSFIQIRVFIKKIVSKWY